MNNSACLLRVSFALGLCLIVASGEASILSKLNDGQSLTIAALGTSLTDASYSSWFGQLGDWLDSQYPGKITLDNEGIGGSNSFSGLNPQLPNALAHNPDAIFIEFAMNDAWTSYGITPEASKGNLQAMIDEIRAWGNDHNKSVDIVIQTMNNDPNSGNRPNLATYYEGYRDVAARNGLLLIDNYLNWINLYDSAPATWHSYVPDGVHPNALGSQNIIMPEIQASLNGQVPEPSAVALAVTGMIVWAAYQRRKRTRSAM